MPQAVRPQVRRTVDHPQGAMDDPAYHPLVDPLPTIPDEDRRAGFGHGQLTAYRQPGVQGPGGRVPVRDGALFVALAQHPYGLPPLVEVTQIEPTQLGHPDTGRIEQFEHRHVADRAGATAFRGDSQCLRQHRGGISTLQRRRQRPHPFRRPQRSGGVLGQPTCLHGPAAEHPDSGRPPLQRAAGSSASLLIGEPRAQ